MIKYFILVFTYVSIFIKDILIKWRRKFKGRRNIYKSICIIGIMYYEVKWENFIIIVYVDVGMERRLMKFNIYRW